MFRFTIRDLLWLTVVIALAVGWYVERRQTRDLQIPKTEQSKLAKEWRTTAGALEKILNDDGWKVYRGEGRVRANKKNETGFQGNSVSDSNIEPRLDSVEAEPIRLSPRESWQLDNALKRFNSMPISPAQASE